MRLPEAADETAEKWTFEQVYQQELGRLRRIVAGMGMRASDGQDVLQEVFLTGLRRPGTWGDRAGVGRWLIRVTVNRCILEFRRRKQFQRSALKILENRAQSNQSSSGPERRCTCSVANERGAGARPVCGPGGRTVLKRIVTFHPCRPWVPGRGSAVSGM